MLEVKNFGHLGIVVPNIEEAELYYSELFNIKTIATLSELQNEGMATNMGMKGLKVSEKVLKFSLCNLVIVLYQFHSPQGNPQSVDYQINDLGGPRHIGLNVGNIESAFSYIKSRKDVEILAPADFLPVSYSKVSPEQFSLGSNGSTQNDLEKQRLAELLSKKKTFYFRDKYKVIWEIEERFF